LVEVGGGFLQENILEDGFVDSGATYFLEGDEVARWVVSTPPEVDGSGVTMVFNKEVAIELYGGELGVVGVGDYVGGTGGKEGEVERVEVFKSTLFPYGRGGLDEHKISLEEWIKYLLLHSIPSSLFVHVHFIQFTHCEASVSTIQICGVTIQYGYNSHPDFSVE
jgi:hypothetical protein